MCFVLLTGADLSRGAAHFAAVFTPTGVEDSRAGGKSSRSVVTVIPPLSDYSNDFL